MTQRVKRILLILGFIVLVILLGYAIYRVFFTSSSLIIPVDPATPTISDSNGDGGLPSSDQGTPLGQDDADDDGLTPSDTADGGLTSTTQLTSASISAASLSTDGGSVQYYDPRDGKFYAIGPNGDVELISDVSFPQAETVVWNNDGSEVVIEFPDGSNIVYGFESGEQTTLPSHWEEFEFSPTTGQIITKSLASDPNAQSLVITNSNASNTQVIAALGENADKVHLSWSPNDQIVAFSETGQEQTGFGRQMILPIGKNSENYKGLTVEGINFDAIWSPNGDFILYDVSGSTSDYKPLLWIVDGTPKTIGDNRQSIGLNTWVDKCTFASNTIIYCAVPQFLPDNAGLQPDLVEASDSIYKINVSTGSVSLIAIPDESVQITSLLVSEDAGYLYYTDSSNQLSQIAL